MGHMRHNAVLVTSWKEELVMQAHLKATEIFEGIAAVTELTPVTINDYSSFMVAPDGSKEFWPHSNKGDQARKDFIAWLDAQRYEDDSTALDWVEVQYGDEEGQTEIIVHSDWRHNQDQ